MLASYLIDSAAEELLDEGNVRWPRQTLLRYLNQAQRALVGVKYDACTAVVNIELTEGIRQKLVAPNLRLLDVIRNVGGDAITLISREVMTDLRAGWMKGRGARAIIHYCQDENSPAEFLVYPPAQDGLQVEVQCTVSPKDCAAESDEIAVREIYETPLVDFMCYRAYLRDSESPGSGAKAAAHFQAFQVGLGAKQAADNKARPVSSYPNKVTPNVQ